MLKRTRDDENAYITAPSASATEQPLPLQQQLSPEEAEKQAHAKAARQNPAITFPYPLDEFQQESIDFLEAGDSVLVSAHTSAGKTTVALYAIAKALREKKRVIYTSPIKALSNQKFNEFSEKFGSVGLMTGDTTIKSDSDCLVMTTEILRSMLYRGAEMKREVGCVIFDEVHYMRDKSRGVVWEETIIMLPEGCQYVFLSATIPNAHEFASWVHHIHPRTTCHVVYTDYRPVPLQHYLYPSGVEGIYLIVDKGQFNDTQFKKAMACIRGGAGAEGELANNESGGGTVPTTGGSRDNSARGKGGFKRGKNMPIMDIIKLVMENKMYPVIVFSFAKVECEKNALALSKVKSFNKEDEESLVDEVFTNAIQSLSSDDQKLPAIENLMPFLRRGIGIHHSGLLPILKEVVELLFQAGLVKVLFSTETFSMGLNMPARTVVFTSVKKFDGEKNRYLTGGEYIQMSGRAGRRGLDKVGIVIAMVDEAVEHDTLKKLMGGGADVLNSSFHLTYNMILNLLRVEDIEPTYMMMRSFAQYQRERSKPDLEAKAASLRSMIANTVIPNENVFKQYSICQTMIAKKESERMAILRQPKYISPFLVQGRLVRVVRAADDANFHIGIVRCMNALTEQVEVSVICEKVDPAVDAREYVPCHVRDYTSETADLYTVLFSFADIAYVSIFRIEMSAGGQWNSERGRADIVSKLAQVHKCSGDEIKMLSGEEMGVEDLGFDKAGIQVEKLKQQLEKNSYFVTLKGRKIESRELSSLPIITEEKEDRDEKKCRASNTHEGGGTLMKGERSELDEPEWESAFAKFEEKKILNKMLEDVLAELKEVSRTVFVEELTKMTRVLRRLDFLDKNDLIQRKARVACEITTTDENEILLTELLFHGSLLEMETEMMVALLSCLVNVHRTPDNFTLPEEFKAPLDELKQIVDRVSVVSLEAGLTTAASAINSTTTTFDSSTLTSSQNNKNNKKSNSQGVGSNGSEKIMPSLMEVTFKWAKGAKFVEIMQITTAYEGDIVRMMRRLEEMLRQLAGAAKSPALGIQELHDKFMDGIKMIKRDIVFASSLYL